jgi:hypothetical protein
MALTATLTADQLADAGTIAVEVVNPAPGGGTSTPVTFTVTPPPAAPDAGDDAGDDAGEDAAEDAGEDAGDDASDDV